VQILSLPTSHVANAGNARGGCGLHSESGGGQSCRGGVMVLTESLRANACGLSIRRFFKKETWDELNSKAESSLLRLQIAVS
jgi:hypothetical protein